jgi:membrane associated rhomboid family serine protease
MGENRRSNFVPALLTSFALVASLFIIAAVQALFHLHLQRFGIYPRTQAGLLGILFAPLLHANLQHLLANAAPLYVLLVLLLSNPAYHPSRTLAFIWFASGLGTWLIGREAIHIGASSIVFGLASFLIIAGLLMRSWWAAFVAIFVAICYGGIFYGVLPQEGPISWEGHLSGALAGAWSARSVARER